ncbi:hypothetical protein PCASD_21779 [Puccinia coronata f. sp. avenae]|uniref:Uncharacterized protein n=1 Tax=Puccinia coronata f. sp. avenae TaxID=200324 RepID=A0A2N5SQU3_9BASI|nr:hypothetical protein PCASD_21779 [Puccinia coronata f. sp. avenae]
MNRNRRSRALSSLLTPSLVPEPTKTIQARRSFSQLLLFRRHSQVRAAACACAESYQLYQLDKETEDLQTYIDSTGSIPLASTHMGRLNSLDNLDINNQLEDCSKQSLNQDSDPLGILSMSCKGSAQTVFPLSRDAVSSHLSDQQHTSRRKSTMLNQPKSLLKLLNQFAINGIRTASARARSPSQLSSGPQLNILQPIAQHQSPPQLYHSHENQYRQPDYDAPLLLQPQNYLHPNKESSKEYSITANEPPSDLSQSDLRVQSNPQALSTNLALPSSPANLATLALSSTQASPVETWRLFAPVPFPPHEAPIDYPVARGAIETPNRLRSQVVTTTQDTLMHLPPPAPSKIALVPTRPTSGLQAGAALTEQANHQLTTKHCRYSLGTLTRRNLSFFTTTMQPKPNICSLFLLDALHCFQIVVIDIQLFRMVKSCS